MAQETTISELAQISSVADDNALMIEDATATKKVTAEQLATYANTKITTIPTSKGGTGNTDGYIRTGIKENTTAGQYSTIEGLNNTGTGANSHTEGVYCEASGTNSHAEGSHSTASGGNSHAEGYNGTASGSCAHVGGSICTASGDYSFASGTNSTASNKYAIAHGQMCEATGEASIALGHQTKATSTDSMAFGERCEANGLESIAIGNTAKAESQDSIAIGVRAQALGYCDLVMGYGCKSGYEDETDDANSGGGSNNVVIGYDSKARQMGYAIGWNTYARGGVAIGEFCSAFGGAAMGYHCETTYASYSGHVALGYYTKSSYSYQCSVGKYNKPIDGRLFIVGNGSSDSDYLRSNALSVASSGVYGNGSYNSSGADYAEMFEWLDGNVSDDDRAGMFVTLDGAKIRLATSEDDYILGVVSGMPSVCGDVSDDQWNKMYQKDIFGRYIYGEVKNPPKYDKDGNVIEGLPETRIDLLINPDYDGSQTYVPRSERPEWDAVGLLGKLVCIDDGTAEVNGYVKVSDASIATKADKRTKYRVMERLDDTHIRIMIL